MLSFLLNIRPPMINRVDNSQLRIDTDARGVHCVITTSNAVDSQFAADHGG